MARGKESVKVSGLRRQGSVSTVPGDGGVKNDEPAREAGEGNSAAEFTKPAQQKMGG